MQEIHETLSPGDVICGRYLVIDLIGTGGFSAVYLVEDQQGEGSYFALKEVSATNQEARRLFTFECSLLKRLAHPSLPRVHQVFENEADNRLYMLMDYVEGPNLQTLRNVQPEKRFSFPMVFAILAPIVDAIAYLHQQTPPIIHRDIKPSNMIVPVVGGKTILVDFGIAKEYDSLETTSAQRHGSRGYGAPEHYTTGTDVRTDIYGLGATLYTLLTGTLPTDALERMMRLTNGEPDPLKPVAELVPGIPTHISMGIERAMSIKKAKRFATIQEFWQAIEGESDLKPPITAVLDSLIASSPVPETSTKRGDASSPPREKRIPRARSRKRVLLSVLLALLLLAGIGVGFWRFPEIRKQPAAPPAPLTTFTPLARQTPSASVSVPPTVYPRLSTSYSGTITDLLANTTYPLTLTNVRQDAGNISGLLSMAQFNGPFTGFLDASKHIYFTVAANRGSASLYFTGSVRANGELDGSSFCQVDQSGSCIPGDVFGLWSALPDRASPVPTRSAFQAGS